MLPLAVIEEICRLLDLDQLSQRKIARQLGVSRGTVGAIANGRRDLYGRERDSHDSDTAPLQFIPARCHDCGGMVFHPCRLCRTRAIKRRQRQLQTLHEQPRRVA